MKVREKSLNSEFEALKSQMPECIQECKILGIPLGNDYVSWGTGIRGLMRYGNPSPRLPGAVSGQRQSWKTPGELGVSSSIKRDIFPSVL